MWEARIVPHPMQSLIENLYGFARNVVVQQAGQRALAHIPLLFAMFTIVLMSNLIGLLPFSFTPTAQIILTFTLAFICNVGIVIIGFDMHGIHFLKLFVPNGGPLWLLPLITVIELISYLLRTFSLAIRLFANMMAGHTLLHILTTFAVGFVNSTSVIDTLFAYVAILAVIGLELGIAFLQAYVFLVLTSIYLNDSYHPSH
jgi:F-type H+-transporting ATPase subunit a